MNLLFFSGDVPIHEWLWIKILVAKSHVSIPLAKLSTAVSKILHLLSLYDIYICDIIIFVGHSISYRMGRGCHTP